MEGCIVFLRFQMCISIADSLHGYYLLNLAKGIEMALEEYYAEIGRLEKYCLGNERNSLSYVYNALYAKFPLLVFMRNLITEIHVLNLRGCVLLHNLHQQCEHGDIQLEKAIKMQVIANTQRLVSIIQMLFIMQNYEAC